MGQLGKIEESVYIEDIKSLRHMNHPELIVDHISSDGFELYGPQGMVEWLDLIGVSYSYLSSEKSLVDDYGYPSFKEVEKNLRDLVAKNPQIAKLISIGKSVQGRDLWVVKISDNVNIDEVEPEFKYISSMHGDEITGRELTQLLIEDLINGYGVDAELTGLINNTEIYIMPSMNPDGSRMRQRANARRMDLNRNFPDWIREDSNSQNKREPETIAVMNFQAQRNFSLSANFHGGAEVVNYPWDNTYKLHPFDQLVQELSLRYADENPSMANSRVFERGITNGASWYVLKGGMQDWSYFWYDDLQVTIEVSRAKWPRYKTIPFYYADNKQSMIEYAKSVHQGAGFKFVDSKTSGVVEIIQKNTDGSTLYRGKYAFRNGEYYKVLPVGEYAFRIYPGNSSVMKIIHVSVENKISSNGNYSHL